MRFATQFWLLCGLMAALLGGRTQAMPFTYQGRLVDQGILANGNYELRFRLFDQLSVGNQVGSDLSKPSVLVTNGLFTVQLDFGPGVFTGAPRWLELAARPSGDAGALEEFDPRQPVTAVPYALFALTSSGDASALTSGTLPDARLGPTITRTVDLLSLSNSFVARLAATNTELQLRLDSLTASLIAISNQFQTLLLPEVTLASTEAADTNLMSRGFAQILHVPAPGWSDGSALNQPSARLGHTAVWTGQSLVVWGGSIGGGQALATGGAYDPVADQWTVLSTLDAPAARSGHTAVWTGQSVIVWGGFGSGFLNSGATFSPAGPTWTDLPALNSPTGRDGQVAVWTGTRMGIWGGRNSSGLLDDGALYDPLANQWSSLPGTGAPAPRLGATAVWTGTQFLVWGGLGATTELGSGGRLALVGGATPGAWQALETVGAPTARIGHSALWTGRHMIIWGGLRGGVRLGDGAAYDPANNTWTPLPTAQAPSPRSGHVAVWSGEEMLIVGGSSANGTEASGGAYSPATGRWRTLSSAGNPVARTQGTGVWTGTQLLVFGGQASGSPLASLERLNPQPSWYFYRKP